MHIVDPMAVIRLADEGEGGFRVRGNKNEDTDIAKL
jgi:hypothetical protein